MSQSPQQKAVDDKSDDRHSSRGVSPTQIEPHVKPWSSPPEPASKAPSTNPPSTTPSEALGPISPQVTDRVFPIRSVISVDPGGSTPGHRSYHQADYFHNSYSRNDPRRQSQGSTASLSSQNSARARSSRNPSQATSTPKAEQPSKVGHQGQQSGHDDTQKPPLQISTQLFSDVSSTKSVESGQAIQSQEPSRPGSPSDGSVRSVGDALDGGMVITGRDGNTLQRCEDEHIHIPGAIQGFGLIVALQEDPSGSGSLPVRIVSENSARFLGRSPRELFALESFTDILSEEQADNLLDHIDFIKDEDADVQTNGPDVFTLSVKVPNARSRKLWCAVHLSDANPGLIICEFELEDDQVYPLVPANNGTPDLPEDTLSSEPTAEEFLDSTETKSRPLRVLRSARKRKGEAAAMEVFNIMSQVQEQLAAAPTLDKFLKVLVGVVKELTGFHRVMVYQFDQSFNGRVVTELVDPRATKDLFKGLNFPASDIPKQARDLYKINKVRMLYDRDQETARLVCRTAKDLETPLDLTHSYLRAMSPIHIKYLSNMAVRSSMSISINAFNELWGLIACHAYGARGMRVSFPIRKMCRLIGDSASRNIERLSYASRLQARKLINTVPTQHNPSGYIIASSDDLLKLFDADFGLLSIHGETKTLGQLDNSQEALAMLEYLRMRSIASVTTSQDISLDFPDLRYPPGFQVIAGLLIVPLSASGQDFIVFFRRGQQKEVKWAGNPYEKYVVEGTSGYLEPRKSFKMWRETVIGKCRDWTEEEIETAAVLCLVYGKFIEVWRQKEAALQSSQLTRLLLANSAHEVRTPLNAIINYLEIALEGSLDSETRENLARSHSASKSLIYVINDLLDLTKTEEGVPLIKGESFELSTTLKEATNMFVGDAKRKNITYEVVEHPGLPQYCIGDQRRVRQAISNITANAIKNTTQGGVKVDFYVASRSNPDQVDVEVAVTDTGAGMSSKKLDQLFNELEQVQSETSTTMLEDSLVPSPTQMNDNSDKTALGLGLAVVARIIKNMNGQLRLKSEEGKGSRFVIQFPFVLPESEIERSTFMDPSDDQPTTPGTIPGEGERTLVAPSPNGNTGNSVTSIEKKPSVDSLKSKASLRSFKSGSSGKSQRSDVDRLIEAIQEPHLVGQRPSSERGISSARPSLSKRHSMDQTVSGSPHRKSSKSSMMDRQDPSAVAPQHRSLEVETAGEKDIFFSGTPLRALKVPDDGGSPMSPQPKSGQILGEVLNEPEEMIEESFSPDNMRVLVAEDDPVNSRIVKKRLEKLGHEVFLTVNGEDCASAFGDDSKNFDVVLMDMQMPIVDGLTSTKMIRSFEKTHADVYSKRAALNGRIPIIAVSASLLENKRQEYIDTGFDAWILKPIAFQRLNTILAAIVDPAIREDCLYQPGEWEQGGWFHMGQKSSQEANTKPSCGPPQLKSSIAHQEAAHSDANSDDPFVDDKVISLPDGESQPRGKGKSVHYEDELQSPTHVSAETPSEPPAEPPSGE